MSDDPASRFFDAAEEKEVFSIPSSETALSSADRMVLLALARSSRNPQTSRLAVEQRMNRSESRTRIFMASSPADTRPEARTRWADRSSF